ncbi:chloroplast tscA maturation factor [Dunaliella salina]|nr:chloroplast tscA maturation factor [Dunaliella salina]|eukprot:KAF5841113.1 chloroplast tscA maturation factor [Dunaliella salina]
MLPSFWRRSWPAVAGTKSCVRAFSSNNKELVSKNLLVDTLQLAKDFEQAGLPRHAADKLAEQITELIVMNRIKMEETFVTNAYMEKVALMQESKVMGFKTELLKAQDMGHANVNKDLDRQQSFLDKMRTELRHEMDKMNSSQRLDLNLEKGRMRDDLQLIRDKTTELEIKVDRDINELKSSVEKGKNDTIKSVITIIGTFSAIAFTISRFVQMGMGAG